MRTIVVSILMLLLCSCVRKNVVGTVVDTKFEFNSTIRDSLVTSWNNLLTNEHIATHVEHLEIIKSEDLGDKSEYYAIIGKTVGDSAKLACNLTRRGDELFFEDPDVSSVVICYGSVNCYPSKFHSKWVCDDGSKQPSCSRDCNKKTVSSVKE